MNKLLKTLFAIEFILILAIVILAFIDDNQKIPTAYAIKENINTENTSFKVMTKAVCGNKSKNIFCHDELFAECNGDEHLISKDNPDDFIECGNIRIRLSDIANGSTKLKKEWGELRKQ